MNVVCVYLAILYVLCIVANFINVTGPDMLYLLELTERKLSNSPVCHINGSF